MFMPVGTAGTMKGLLPEQVESTGCRLMLSNTYHLSIRPGVEVVEKAGGLHSFMKWPHSLLTDSGGFQMVSLNKLMELTEEGVEFESPYNHSKTLLTPEESINVQVGLGSNIMMQLDDVVSSTAHDDNRYKTAMERSIRWLDRCLERQSNNQSLFPIVQGGLNKELRRASVQQILERDTNGIAIGGLSGGEGKESFVEMVSVSTKDLPEEKPRYLMGVGFPVDIILCCSLGCDLFDCVYPTRTARFGTALIGYGQVLNFRNCSLRMDSRVLDMDCDCTTCCGSNGSKGFSRSYIHYLYQEKNEVACHLLSVHNIRFMMRFMEEIRLSVVEGKFEQHLFKVLDYHFDSRDKYPQYVIKALDILNI